LWKLQISQHYISLLTAFPFTNVLTKLWKKGDKLQKMRLSLNSIWLCGNQFHKLWVTSMMNLKYEIQAQNLNVMQDILSTSSKKFQCLFDKMPFKSCSFFPKSHIKSLLLVKQRTKLIFNFSSSIFFLITSYLGKLRLKIDCKWPINNHIL